MKRNNKFHKDKNKNKNDRKKKEDFIETIWVSKVVALGLFLFLAFFISAPFYVLASSSVSVLLAKKSVMEGDLKTANKLLLFTKDTAGFSERNLILYSQIPLFGRFFESGVYLSDLLQRTSDIGIKTVFLADYSSELAGKILGNDPYSIEKYTQRILLELDSLYNDIGFLQSEIEDSLGLARKTFKLISGKEGAARLRKRMLLARELVVELPELLGKSGKKTYLVLFQNNMELRPTGGFIGSFALVTFENGRLIEISVQDVYSADGQLRGHVEPPVPIKKHLDEANWFLRDSNWDPNFPTSAERAEWFLDKEIERKVDGVIGIDLELAREILMVTGPITLTDFNLEVDHKNLYEKTQYEVEKDFFPGSRKKANFLTALTRELLVRISEVPPNDYFETVEALIKSLSARHVQIFLHNKGAAKVISAFGWDGAVETPVCSGSCFSDWIGVVEANMGVNKANYFIKRSASMIISFENGFVKRFLSISYVNDAQKLLGKLARYKAYVRIIVPPESEVLRTELARGSQKELLNRDIEDIAGRKEIGVLVQIDPGQSKSVNFSWREPFDINFNSHGEYWFLWRKQAGTAEDPIVVRFFFPRGVKVYGNPAFSLTETTSVGYNSILTGDFISHIYW